MNLCLSDTASLNLLNPPYCYEGLSLAIVGNKGCGKSWTMAVLSEEAHRNQLPFVYYDVNGDACSLRELGEDVLVIGRPGHWEPVRRAHVALADACRNAFDYMRLVLTEGYSLVIDLSGLPVEEQALHFATLATAHFRLAEDLREPCLVLVDEAHRFAPQKDISAEQRESLKALTAVMSDGRKRGILLAFATQRATFLNKNVLFGANVRMFGKLTWFPDFKEVRSYLPPGTSFQALSKLPAGTYYLISPNNWGQIRIRSRQTPDLGATPVIRSRSQRARPSVRQLCLFDGPVKVEVGQ